MRTRSFLAVLATLSFFAVACGSSGSPSATTPVTAPATTACVPATNLSPTSSVPVEKSSVFAYFLLAEKLHVAGRLVPTADPAAAVDALLAGPTVTETAARLVSLIPVGTKLLGVDVRSNEITVDLSGQFGSGEGNLSVSARVAQMVCTLMQFPGIDQGAIQLGRRCNHRTDG